ncbi:MAG: TnsA endonuclease N-terminal domain-containing protein [Candidatus Methylopumilus sp.]|jgi:hypothetical protein
MGVRKIKANYRSVTGTHGPSGQDFESSLEQLMMVLLEFDPYVERFDAQPLQIEYKEDGKLRSYVPDLLIHFKKNSPYHPRRSRPLLCEIKYRSDYVQNFAEIRPKVRQGLRYAKLNQYRFDVITDIKIKNTYLQNVLFLRRYHNKVPQAHLHQPLISKLKALKKTTPNILIRALSGDLTLQAEYLFELWIMVCKFEVLTDLNVPLNQDSVIFHNNGGRDLCQLISSPVL